MKYLCLTIIIFLSSCSECINDDCPSNRTFGFKIIDEDGNNLLILPNEKFSFKSLKVTGLSYDNTFDRRIFLTTDYVQVPLTSNQTGIIISYGGMETDTLDILNKRWVEVDCCSAILEDFSVKLNKNLLCQSCGTTMAVIKKVC